MGRIKKTPRSVKHSKQMADLRSQCDRTLTDVTQRVTQENVVMTIEAVASDAARVLKQSEDLLLLADMFIKDC